MTQILTNCGVGRNTPEGCRERRKQQLTKIQGEYSYLMTELGKREKQTYIATNERTKKTAGNNYNILVNT